MEKENILPRRLIEIGVKSQSPQSIADAISDLKQFRRGKYLNGLSIKGMIEEGRVSVTSRGTGLR